MPDFGAGIQTGILLFWAVWWTVVFATNLLDGLRAAGRLDSHWKFASGNLQAIREVTGIYRIPAWVAAVLFSGVVAWCGLSMVLMWRAVAAHMAAGSLAGLAAAHTAFSVGLGLFAAFIVADEIFLAHAMATKHLTVFLALLTSLLAVRLLSGGP